jgi:hypothetical protein
MIFELDDYKRELTDDEILDDIKSVASSLGNDYISIATYKQYGKHSQCAIQNHFGTWKNALSLAGLRNTRTAQELKRISDDEYFSDLRRVASITHSTTVLYRDYQKYGKYAVEHIFKRFGEWDTALVAAGLEETGLARKRIGEQELFDEIERMWRLLGRQPTTTDIIKNGLSKYSIDPYKRRFGGWRKALEAFVAYINEGVDPTVESEKPSVEVAADTTQKPETSVAQEEVPTRAVHRTSRNVTTRMRFLVMKRDNFKCCKCGASPAKDPSVELHIDHIKPWSKGGETVIDNLQTLCSKCNLGKSDLE